MCNIITNKRIMDRVFGSLKGMASGWARKRVRSPTPSYSVKMYLFSIFYFVSNYLVFQFQCESICICIST